MLHRIIGSFVTGLFQNIQEQTKALVFVSVFVFVFVDEQALSTGPNNEKPVAVTAAWCEVFEEVPTTYHFSVSELPS